MTNKPSFLKSPFFNPLLLILFLLSGFSSIHAQNAQLQGQVLDSVSAGIPNTNLIATPVSDEENITFAIADRDGAYKLTLTADVSYKIEITSLGFSSLTDTLRIAEDTNKDFHLKESTESLEEVVVKAKMAMIVKEDTITYRTDKFKTGDERKLKELLEKLPGVEVDRDGNVTVNGKKVSKLMVDGKDFFGGDTRLGVKNIPADAVEEVEAIDNYNEVSFMKGLSDSDRMAMNIKLKKDKKDFVFGETQAGGGIEDRYYIHPTLFYYSPNTTFNFIGSFNNINESPLDFQDVIRFKGGYMSFIDNPVQSGDAGLTQFSNSTDIKHKKMKFGAANFTQKISKNLRLEAYAIVAQQEVQSESETQTEYLTQDQLIENRETYNTDKGFSNFNKIKLRYTPEISKDLAYDLLANVTNNRYRNQLDSYVSDSLNHTASRRDPHDVEINQYFRYNTQPTYEHTSEIKAEHSFKKSNRLSEWDFDRPVFSEIIPFIDEEDADAYHFNQDYASTTHSGRVNFKHYWVLNNTNHLYPQGGLYFFDQSYNTQDYQSLMDGSINDFGAAGFNNDLQYHLINPYIGFQYKFKIGEVIFRPGLMYQHYFWQAKQFSEKIAQENKGILLPEFKLEYKMSSSRKLEFNYNLKSSFADAEKYANRLSLRSFNQLYQGNEDLENSIYHQFSLMYRNFSLASGLTYNLNLNYRRQEKSISQSTVLEGIDQISTTFYSSFPENNLSFMAFLNKRWKYFSSGLRINASISDYSRVVNEEKLDYDAQSLQYRLNFRTRFKDLPNLDLGLSHRLSRTSSDDFKNRYTSLSPYADLRYNFWEDFILKANYEYNHTKDHSSSQSQDFQLAHASLFYSKDNSPWGFEIRVDNIFDVRYKRSHSVDQFMIYDRKIYVQPRTALFVISYQL
ncbi:MAG TPA: carboxypeptidase-like regulatory domain-containing protein [Flavobacteriaceae bacterium]|nr:carboxypeptidase-like regulatory domain-containing protein [Flavobacteriaceae bacterium]